MYIKNFYFYFVFISIKLKKRSKFERFKFDNQELVVRIKAKFSDFNDSRTFDHLIHERNS